MTATDPEEIALAWAALAAPGDDLPRLVYTDWLEEHGEEELAKFMRLTPSRPPESPT